MIIEQTLRVIKSTGIRNLARTLSDFSQPLYNYGCKKPFMVSLSVELYQKTTFM